MADKIVIGDGGEGGEDGGETPEQPGEGGNEGGNEGEGTTPETPVAETITFEGEDYAGMFKADGADFTANTSTLSGSVYVNTSAGVQNVTLEIPLENIAAGTYSVVADMNKIYDHLVGKVSLYINDGTTDILVLDNSNAEGLSISVPCSLGVARFDQYPFSGEYTFEAGKTYTLKLVADQNTNATEVERKVQFVLDKIVLTPVA